MWTFSLLKLWKARWIRKNNTSEIMFHVVLLLGSTARQIDVQGEGLTQHWCLSDTVRATSVWTAEKKPSVRRYVASFALIVSAWVGVSAMIFRHQTRILTLISGCAKFYGKGVDGSGLSLLWDALPKIKEGKPRLESKIKMIFRLWEGFLTWVIRFAQSKIKLAVAQDMVSRIKE